MLRIIKEYPIGWARRTPRIGYLVSRDTSWLVHGFDYFCRSLAGMRSMF